MIIIIKAICLYNDNCNYYNISLNFEILENDFENFPESEIQ